jgi:hypothetical protein
VLSTHISQVWWLWRPRIEKRKCWRLNESLLDHGTRWLWEGLGIIKMFKNNCKCCKILCRSTLDVHFLRLIFLHLKPKWKLFSFHPLILPSIYFRISTINEKWYLGQILQEHEHWTLLVINIITFSTMGSFNSQPFFYKKTQNNQLEIPQQLSQPSIGFVTKDRAQKMM